MVRYDKDIQKDIRGGTLPKEIGKLFYHAFSSLDETKDLNLFDIKKLVTNSSIDYYRLRKGKYTVRLGSFDGKTFMPLKQQLPGMVSPMQKADGMIITTPDIGLLQKGMKVKVLPILWELNSVEKEDFFTR